MSSEGFDPNDVYELEGIFTEIVSDSQGGFVLEFIISVLAAKELIDLWELAQDGNAEAHYLCMEEYGKIVEKLEEAIYGSDE